MQLHGGFGLFRADGTNLTPRSRRARALLAYLALTPPHRASRERLAALLWSERGEQQARASLRQLLLELRSMTDQHGPIAVSRGEIQLDRASISTDLDVLAEAARADDGEALIAALDESDSLLLDEMDDLSAAYAEWLPGQRERTREIRREIVLRSARDASARGDHATAFRLACHLILSNPLDEAATVVAMEAAGETGDRAAVGRLFAGLKDALRSDLDVEPSGTTVEAFERLMRVRSLGAAEARPPTTAGDPEARLRLSPSGPFPTPATQPSFRRWAPKAGALAILIGLIVTAATTFRAKDDGLRNFVLIAPATAASPDPASRAFSAGLSATVARDLVGTGTSAQIIDASARSLRPTLIVESTLAVVDRHAQASVRILHAASHLMVWSGDFTRPDEDVNLLIEQVALQIGRELHCAYDEPDRPSFDDRLEIARSSLAACDAVGRDFDDAARFSAQVVAGAPDFARGWSEYAAAVAVGSGELPPEARTAARARAVGFADHAITLDRNQGLAYFAIATTQDGTARWIERERTVANGLAVSPNNAELNNERAADLADIGRLADALAYSRRSYSLDHFLPGKLYQLISIEMDLGQFDDAKDLLSRADIFWPSHPWFAALRRQWILRQATNGEGRYTKTPGAEGTVAATTDDLILRWRQTGSKADGDLAAQAIIAKAGPGPVDAGLVQSLAGMGRVDDAYRLAGHVAPSAGRTHGWFAQDLAAFRADRRFMALARRLGLTLIWQSTGLWPDFCRDPGVGYDCRTEAAARTRLL